MPVSLQPDTVLPKLFADHTKSPVSLSERHHGRTNGHGVVDVFQNVLKFSKDADVPDVHLGPVSGFL